MNLLFVADIPPDPSSGAAGTEYQTLQALSALGVEIDEVWNDELSHRIQHGNLHYLLELPRSIRNQVNKKMLRRKYDVIHVNQPHGYLAARELKRSGCEAVFIHRSHGFELRVKRDLAQWYARYGRSHQSVVRSFLSGILGFFLAHNCRKIAEYADGHIVSASECRDYLINELRVPAEKVAVIPQAAPGSFLDAAREPIRPERLKKILYVGQFAFVKAPIVLAEVFNNLAAAREDVELTWVCAAEHHQQARQLLGTVARERVVFHDWVDQDELRTIYDAHGIFLFPSFFEGFGKAFLEAMSRGLCVVASDNGGMKDILEQNITGLKVPTGDIGAMTKSCINLLENPEKAIIISGNAIKASTKYSWERVAEETLSFYETLLREKRKLRT